jgi:hypothetical protein
MADNASTANYLRLAASANTSSANTSAQCRAFASEVSKNTPNVSSSTADLSSMIASLSTSLNSLDDTVSAYASTYLDYLVYGYYGVSTFLVLVYLLGTCCRLKLCLQINIFFSELYMLLLTLLVALLLVVLVSHPVLANSRHYIR